MFFLVPERSAPLRKGTCFIPNPDSDDTEEERAVSFVQTSGSHRNIGAPHRIERKNTVFESSLLPPSDLDSSSSPNDVEESDEDGAEDADDEADFVTSFLPGRTPQETDLPQQERKSAGSLTGEESVADGTTMFIGVDQVTTLPGGGALAIKNFADEPEHAGMLETTREKITELEVLVQASSRSAEAEWQEFFEVHKSEAHELQRKNENRRIHAVLARDERGNDVLPADHYSGGAIVVGGEDIVLPRPIHSLSEKLRELEVRYRHVHHHYHMHITSHDGSVPRRPVVVNSVHLPAGIPAKQYFAQTKQHTAKTERWLRQSEGSQKREERDDAEEPSNVIKNLQQERLAKGTTNINFL